MSFLSIEGYWRELLLALCKPIYKLIVYLYDLFEVIGTAEILTNETLTTIYNRVGMLLGLYMLFRIIFSFVQMLINPDIITDKEKGIGNIVKKSILVVILMGITPFIFEKAIEIQNYIVGVNTGKNVIANLVLPGGSAYVSSNDSFGIELSSFLFGSFYRYDDDVPEELRGCEALEKVKEGSEITKLHNSIKWSKGDISYAKLCLDLAWTDTRNYQEQKYQIPFTSNGIFAVGVGLIVCYVLLIYTIMVGARVIQLAFLRIISPMAILGYLSPKKDGIFEKWLKMCTTTYVDLFIRMAIIYFVIFVVNALIGGTDGIALAKPFEHMWMINLIMIIALLLFAKKAPELLKELFPKSGGVASLGFGLKSPKKLIDDMMFGSTINKGFSSIGKKIRKVPGNFARQSMGRIDVLRHGGTWEEAKVKYPGFLGRKRINWMKENAPLAYKSYENKVAGNQELADMHSNWVRGDALRQSLINKYGTTPGFNPDKWADVFDGSDGNKKYYEEVYKSKEFAESTRSLDYAKEKMKAFSAVHAGLSTGKAFSDLNLTSEQIAMVQSMLKPGQNVNDLDATSFNSIYEKQQKIVSATEKTHESLRKVHGKDAEIEDQISFRKNNETDPTGR